MLPANTLATGNVSVAWPDLSDIATLEVTNSGSLNQLFDFSQLDTDDILGALKNVATYLANFEQFSFLKEKLPLLNESLSGLLGLVISMRQS